MTGLKLTTETRSGGIAVIAVEGDVDIYTAPRLREVLKEADAAGCGQIVLDLGRCTFLDPTGLGVIVAGLRRARERDGSLALACGSESILKIFRITGLTKVFRTFGSADEAVQVLRHREGENS